MIDDLLDLTRIGRGGLHLDLRPVDAHESVRQAVEIYRREISAGGLVAVLDLTAPAHHVQADPARLQQIVWNLIQNAVKFTPRGGTIRVRSRSEQAPGDGSRLIIEVSDTGIGLEPEVLPRIFEGLRAGRRGAPQGAREVWAWGWRSAGR